MTPDARAGGSAVLAAMLCSAAITAQFVAGRATRDALFLANFDVTSLPLMVVMTSVVSIGLAVAGGRLLRRWPPAALLARTFLVSAAFFVLLWGTADLYPRASAVVLYLQVAGIGPMLGSAFWLIATERFDPRAARRSFGRIGAAGTIGGLVGGLLAERLGAMVDVGATLPLLSVLCAISAWLVVRLAAGVSAPATARKLPPSLAPESARSGLRLLVRTPYLRHLASLVVLGTLAAALMDYLFKVQVVATQGQGEKLLRFFAIYYASVSFVTFLVQLLLSRPALARLGLAAASGTPSAALIAGGLGVWFAPGLASTLVARGIESVMRGSLYRSSYEIFYTPVPATEKRAAKSIVDVGFDRLGDAVGGLLLRALFLLPVAVQLEAILTATLAAAAGALVAASRLSRGYVRSLERSLLNRAVELDIDDIDDLTTRTTMLRTVAAFRGLQAERTTTADQASGHAAERRVPAPPATLDKDVQQILVLHSRDRDEIRPLLRADDGVAPSLVPHIIPLLAWDAIAGDALFALRKVAEPHIGQLTDALIDPDTEFAVRRRLARVFSVCVSQRAADGLVRGLHDPRFEVRYQCARSLLAIMDRNPRVEMDQHTIFEAVRKETSVGRAVWRSERLLQKPDEREDDSAYFVDEFVKDRSNRSLAHVFTLLSLVLPADPLRIAFRGLHTDDTHLRGTALEYLEGVLPVSIREPLWPFLEDRPQRAHPQRPREDVLADLLRSNQSIALNLEAIRRGARKP